jgi:hypothetical protein
MHVVPQMMAKLDRSHPQNVTLTPVIDKRSSDAVLDILVHALGRVNFGCVWDNKGLSSPDVKLDGETRTSLSYTASAFHLITIIVVQANTLGLVVESTKHGNKLG